MVFISVIGSKVHVLLWCLLLLSHTGVQHYTYHVFNFYFTIVISVTFSAQRKRFSVHSCLHLFARGNMSYLRYLCLFVYSGIQHILPFCFVCLRLVHHILPVSLDCPYLIAPLIFSKVYFLWQSTFFVCLSQWQHLLCVTFSRHE